MIYVPLSKKEIEVIRFVLERYRKAMIFEINQTGPEDARKSLRERDLLLQALNQKLETLSGEEDT
jgi:hypothetical protein